MLLHTSHTKQQHYNRQDKASRYVNNPTRGKPEIMNFVHAHRVEPNRLTRFQHTLSEKKCSDGAKAHDEVARIEKRKLAAAIKIVDHR